MPKQVKGQEEGDLGKPLAGQKRDRAKRLALNKGEKGKEKMQGAGEMLVGRTGTRSSETRAEEACQYPMSRSKRDQFLFKVFKDWARKYSKVYKTTDEEKERFKLWCSTKQRMDANYSDGRPGGILDLNSFADWTDDEKEQARLGIPSVDDPYEFNQRTPEFYEMKLEEVLVGGHMGTRRAKEVRDKLMYKMFKGWAKKHKKSYVSSVEEDKRFKIWCSTKERIDAKNSLQPGDAIFGLNFLSDLTDFEKAEYRGGSVLVDDPYNGNDRTPEFYESKLGKKVAKEEKAFDEWVAKHNIEYDSEWELDERFAFYFRNKKRMETLRKENPGCYSNYPCELDNVMDRVLSINKLKKLLRSDSSNQGCSQ